MLRWSGAGTSVFLSSETGVSGNIWCRIKGAKYRFALQDGTWFFSWEAIAARASSWDDVGNTWFFSSCGGILELRRGFLASSCVGPGKPNLPFELRGRAGGCARVTAGQKKPHPGLCLGPNVPLKGWLGSWGCILDSPRSQASSRGETKDFSLFSSRDGYFLEPTEWTTPYPTGLHGKSPLCLRAGRCHPPVGLY